MSCARCGGAIHQDATHCPACGTSWTDLKRMAMTVFLLLGFDAFVSLGSAVYLTRLSRVLGDMTDEGYAEAPIDRAMATYAAALAISVLLMIATGPLFVAWLWQARRIADARRARHARPRRHRPGQVIGGRVSPGLSPLLPPRIVRDVWLATAPAPAPAERRWAGVVVRAWWLGLAAGLALQAMYLVGDVATLDRARLLTSVQIAGACTVSLAAVLGMLIVFRINRLQYAP
jgi:hypothetical protein